MQRFREENRLLEWRQTLYAYGRGLYVADTLSIYERSNEKQNRRIIDPARSLDNFPQMPLLNQDFSKTLNISKILHHKIKSRVRNA